MERRTLRNFKFFISAGFAMGFVRELCCCTWIAAQVIESALFRQTQQHAQHDLIFAGSRLCAASMDSTTAGP